MTRTLTLLAALLCALSATANAIDAHVEAVIRSVEGATGNG
ncbi:MAG: hypothetical protein WCT04_23225 [Planctomycetota bacterium]